MNIVTGYRGEAHITAAQDRAGNQGAIGTGSYIMNVGNKLQPVVQSANEVRIKDGAVCHQGCIGVIAAGSYEAVSIANGAQGMNRTDLIVCRYTKNAGTGVESLDIVCIQGTASSGTPETPSYNTGNIQNGDSPVDMPLFEVHVTGITIDSVTQVAQNVMTQAETDALIGAAQMGTTAQTIKGAIAELGEEIANVRETQWAHTSGSVSVNADGWTELQKVYVPANPTNKRIAYRIDGFCIWAGMSQWTNYAMTFWRQDAEQLMIEEDFTAPIANTATGRQTANYLYQEPNTGSWYIALMGRMKSGTGSVSHRWMHLTPIGSYVPE